MYYTFRCGDVGYFLKEKMDKKLSLTKGFVHAFYCSTNGQVGPESIE
jgi:hypothetical protein